MNFLTDTQAESVHGGGMGFRSLVPPINISVAPVVAILPQTAVSVNTAVLGGRIFNAQGQLAGIGVLNG
jgi:hypothetical protein